MSNEAFTITETERACGVTSKKVRRAASRAYLTADGAVIIDATSPALAGAAARAVLGRPAQFVGGNGFGHMVYRAA